ncbi:MAG TPA: sensor domain-containing diguanylate cyclase [Acidimicrobiales bacterium]|nr:sensor domain-containing diguanylate cyclase [Acidimicrobiales bacterium]
MTEAVRPSAVEPLVVTALGAAAVVVGLLVPRVPWERLPRLALVAVPLLGQTMIGLGGLLAPGATQRYIVLYALTYLFVGLTQRPGVAFALMPYTVISYAAGTWPYPSWLDFVGVLSVAVLIAETLSRTAEQQRQDGATMVGLLDAARRLTRSEDLEQATEVLVDAITELLDTDLVAVLAADPDHPGRFIEMSGNDSVAGYGPMAIDTRAEHSGVGDAVERGEAIFVADTRRSDIASRRLVETTGLVSVLFIPLVGHRACLGAVVTGWRRTMRGLDDLERLAVEVLSTEAGLVLERLQETARLAEEAEREPLTDLANRRAFARALADAGPGDAVVMIDLDGFKAINDRYGHGLGDDVLLTMADCLRRACRTEDCVSRFGGDEFAVVLRGGHDEGARQLVDRLAAAWRETDPLLDYSVGYAVVGADEPAAAALERADQALYRAKRRQPMLVPD